MTNRQGKTEMEATVLGSLGHPKPYLQGTFSPRKPTSDTQNGAYYKESLAMSATLSLPLKTSWKEDPFAETAHSQRCHSQTHHPLHLEPLTACWLYCGLLCHRTTEKKPHAQGWTQDRKKSDRHCKSSTAPSITQPCLPSAASRRGRKGHPEYRSKCFKRTLFTLDKDHFVSFINHAKQPRWHSG